MDRSLDVRTPESVVFAYQLAGVGSRFLAVVADMVVQVLFLVAFGLLLSSVVARTHLSPVTRLAENVMLGIAIFIAFIVLFGYFILFEAFWNGQTPGKKLLGIRVVRDGGYPIDFSASLIRNLIRVGELGLGFYATSALSALLSNENKRIGDFAAGTIVVRDASVDAPATDATLGEPAAYAATMILSGEERALVHRFIERRRTLSTERREQLAAQLAQRVRPRVGPDLARLDDESLLERL